MEVQQRLNERGKRVSLVFIAAHDAPGKRHWPTPLAFLRKPYDDEALLRVLAWVVAQASRPRL